MKLNSKLKPRRGAGLVEYGLIAGLVSVMAIAAVLDTGEEVETVFCFAANGVAEGMGRDAPLDDCGVAVAGGGGGKFVGGGSDPYSPIDADMLLTYSGNRAIVMVGNVGPGTLVDWGDGSPAEELNGGTNIHNYASAGTYQVRIQGQVGQLGASSGSSCVAAPQNLVSVDSFGGTDVGLTSLDCAFFNADDLQSVAQIPPGVTSLNQMMKNSDANPTGMRNWNVSQVTDFSKAFQNARSFNQSLSGWNTSSGIDFFSVFDGAESFNQPISGWNVGSAIDMSSMFNGAVAFNQPLRGWDVSSVTDMSSMFNGATSFNQDLDNWDVSSVTTMNQMFYKAYAFNGNIDNWDVSAAESFRWMFREADTFNRSLNWDVSNVTAFNGMFYNADSFNGDITGWRPDTTKALNFRSMFHHTDVFNQPIGAWNLRQTSDIEDMFRENEVFNRNLSSWCFSSSSQPGYDKGTTAWEEQNKPTFNCAQ